MAWTVETLNETVDAELSELPADMIVLAQERARELKP
jgi:hypothetical protein